MSTPQDPQDPPYPFPGPPFPLPDPDAPPHPDEDEPPPVPLPSSVARDPRLDPQTGDEFRGGPWLRRVIRRDGDGLVCQTGLRRYRMRVTAWREWCEKSGAKAATKGKKGGEDAVDVPAAVQLKRVAS